MDRYRLLVTISVAVLAACVCCCFGSPHFRRQIDITVDPSQQDPEVVDKGLHRPLAVLCPSVDITDILSSSSDHHSGPINNGTECGPKCEFDSDCTNGALCCSSKCGSRSCVPPVQNPSTAGGLDRADMANLICGRFICSQRLKEACVTVVLKSCKPTSVDFECPTTQQCLPRGAEDCSTKTCPDGTRCVMVECGGRGYCNPLPKCLGNTTSDTPSSTAPASSTAPPRAPPRPQGPGGFPNFPSFPSRFSTPSTTSTSSVLPSSTSSSTSGLTSSVSQSVVTTEKPSLLPSSTMLDLSTSASTSSSLSATSSESPTPVSSSAAPTEDLTPSASTASSASVTSDQPSPVPSLAVVETSPVTSLPPTTSSTTQELASASAAALDGNSDSGSSSTKPPTTTLEYIASSSSAPASTSEASSPSAAAAATSEATSEASSPSASPTTPDDVPTTATLSTSASTVSQGPSTVNSTSAEAAGFEEQEEVKCSTPCGPGFTCKKVSIQGCAFVDGTLVCNFENQCIPDALPSCQPDTCAPWETCVLEGKGCRSVTSPSAASEMLLSRRCGPECYAPILGPTPTVGQFNCGRSGVKCKTNEACVPVVQSTCEFNAAADLECDYIDSCVPKDMAESCQDPETGCQDDEHCVLQVADECPLPANPNDNCPPQVQCYGLSLNLTTGACADFECEKGDVCADMAKDCDYDKDGDLQCEFQDACVPAAVAKDCDNDVGCTKDETCILEYVTCVNQPCYPSPRCTKKRNPAMKPSQGDQELIKDVPLNATTAGNDDEICGADVCRINEFCTKVTNKECDYKGAPECTFKKACLPERAPTCRQALCPPGHICVNIEVNPCTDFFCHVDPKCIPLTDPSLTTTEETTITEEETTSPGETSSSGSGVTAAASSSGAAEVTQAPLTSPSTVAPPVAASSGKACGKGKKAQICNADTEFCGEVAVTCTASSLTSPRAKLSCRYEERCLRTGAPSCLTQRCSDGRHCIMREVRCVSAPCDPVPECVRRADYDVNPRIARLFSELFVNR